MYVDQNTALIEWKIKLQTGRRYLQFLDLIKALHLKHLQVGEKKTSNHVEIDNRSEGAI